MLDFLAELFDTSDFPARWNCGRWTEGHGWLHVFSDLGVWSAYFTIPLVLGTFVLRRHDLPFRKVFLLFAAFILLCGSTHLMEAIIFWWPAYRLAGVLKLATALISWGTVIALLPVIPKALTLRGPAELERDVERRTAELARANAALRASEERNRVFFESSAVGMVQVDAATGRFEQVNDAFAQLVGYSRAELQGKPVADLTHPDDWERDRVALRALAEGSQFHYDVEKRYYRKDGEVVWVRVVATMLRETEGRGARAAAVVQDIGDRKESEAALRQSESQFRTLAEAVPQIVWVARPDGWHEFFNARWYEYTKLTPEESIGDGWTLPLHPDDRGSGQARWKEATESGEMYQIEYRFRRYDGVYRWFLGRAVPDRDEEGTIRRWFGTCTDIDDAKQAEQKAAFLADASARLAEVLDYRSTMQKVADAAVPVFADWITIDLLDERGELQRLASSHAIRERADVAVEMARQYPPGCEDPHGPGRVLASGNSDLVPEVTPAAIQSLARDGEHLRLLRELEIRSLMSVPLQAKGKLVGIMTFVASQSGRRYNASDLMVAEELGRRAAVAIENAELYEALKEADQRKDEFLATLAHELRNPLAPIRMGLEVMRLEGGDPGAVPEMLKTMESQVQHMVRLIDDLLDVSRITRGKLELRKARVQLKHVVQTAVEAARPLIAEAGHHLRISLPEEPLVVDADPARLSQVFSNLLNNAAKYTPAEGQIELAAERQGSDVVISVRDNGIGIPPEMLEKIFDLFTQVDRSLERSASGLGIGLTLVRRLVEMHGGSVEARSDGEGRGSELLVRLPMVLTSAVNGQTGDELGAAQGRTGRRVLVADDNKDAADMLARLLKVLGHETRVVYDGQAAVEAAESYRPEVCLLDIGMPKLNGYEVCRSIRSQAWGERMSLIALTGWGQTDDRRRSKEAGFDHHLVKPVEPAALQELLQGLKC